MSVQRCPNCGRAWDGSMCFACGHEAGKAVTQTSGAASARVDAPAVAGSSPPPPSGPPAAPLPAPSTDSPFLRDQGPPLARSPSAVLSPPAFAAAAPAPPPYAPPAPAPPPAFHAPPLSASGVGAGPNFAPLPPLPPLPRPPSGAFAPGAALSGPAALPRTNTQPTTPAPNLGPPSFAAAPATAPGPASVAGGQLPPQPITFPGPPTTGAARARGTAPSGPPSSWPTPGPAPRHAPPSSPAAAAPALDVGLENTADVERPRGGIGALVQRVWASPAAFALVFVVGFVATFAPGAAWKLRSPDLQAMIDAGQPHNVVAVLEAREKDGSISKGDWVLYGHAIAAAYGTLRRTDMLAKYAVAVQSKRVDATALQNTIEALGDPDVQRDAVALLKLDWPRDLETEARLQERTGDDNVLLRHGAVDALVARKAPADLVRSVRARVAVADLKTRACPTTADGVAALKDLIADKATAALRERKVADALLDLQGDSDLAQLPCIDKKTVRTLHQQVAALLEGG